MYLKFPCVVVPREPEFFQARHDRLVDDLHDIGHLLVLGHAMVKPPIMEHRHIVMCLLPRTHNVGKIEIDLQAGPIFHQWDTVPITNLAAHRREADSQLGVTLDTGLIIGSTVDLHIPHACKQEQKGNRDQDCDDRNLAVGKFRGLHDTGLRWRVLRILPERVEFHQSRRRKNRNQRAEQQVEERC